MSNIKQRERMNENRTLSFLLYKELRRNEVGGCSDMKSLDVQGARGARAAR